MAPEPTSGALQVIWMNKTSSLYLDFLRLMTALVVFLVHANYGRFTGGLPIICDLKFLGNDGVMVFFVLSGFVISYVSDKKEVTARDFAISRLARLYSVVIPAVILTIIVDFIGSSIDYSIYDGWWFQTDNPIWRVSASLMFVNELWFSSVRLFSNGPFWSLGYEFWYYVIFGAAYYLEGYKRVVIVLAALLIAGPKILLLFPVWLLGVLTYRITRRAMVAEPWGWGLYLGSIALYCLFESADIPRLLLEWSEANLNGVFFWTELKWSYATPFLSCYAVGTLAALHVIGLTAISHRVQVLIGPFGGPIRHLAGFTFSIYLFHYPLLQFFTAITGGIADQALKNAMIVFGTLAVIYALGTATEMRRAEFKRLIATGYDTIRRGFVLRPL